MASLRHCNFVRRVFVTVFCFNCVLILMTSSWDDRRYTPYYAGIQSDQLQTRTHNETYYNIPLSSTNNTSHKRLPLTTASASAKPTPTSFQNVSSSSSSSYSNVAQRLQQRVNHTRQQCQLKWAGKLGPYLHSQIFFDPQGKMAQCNVAKAGSTYWGRIFSFLTRPEVMKSFNIHVPAQIDRAWIHHRRGVRGKAINGNDTDTIFKDVHPLRFFFARDPYKRLWSTYLDKYYLPGYWTINPLGDKVSNSSLDINSESELCRKNISFQTFLEDAVQSDDLHVIPISTACNPCVFKPDIIGDMATFSSDTQHVLRQTNYSHLLSDYNDESFTDREIRSLSSYNFILWRKFKKCLDQKELAQRLWRVFQYNGYIRKSSVFPETRPEFSAFASTQMFVDEAKSRPVMSKKESRRQKNEFLVEAYKAIPRWLLQRVRDRFAGDFELFGYDVNTPR